LSSDGTPSLITAIAEQTNLLALKPPSRRHGPSGAGQRFAVVAYKLKALAGADREGDRRHRCDFS
jgi:methyl-accepting chemotaxis protein